MPYSLQAQETLNYWKQLNHVMKYFRIEEDPKARLPHNFISGFLEVCNCCLYSLYTTEQDTNRLCRVVTRCKENANSCRITNAMLENSMCFASFTELR